LPSGKVYARREAVGNLLCMTAQHKQRSLQQQRNPILAHVERDWAERYCTVWLERAG